MSMVDLALMKLEEQQAAVQEYSPQWMVAEQLKDICRREPASAELIYQDLGKRSMGIKDAEKQIKALADQRHKSLGGSAACVSPAEAEQALRTFYGLPDPHLESQPPAPRAVSINLADFLR